MRKPDTIDGYTDDITADCERVLITLLRGLEPWKESVSLVGGLIPRYLVPARPPAMPPHAGTPTPRRAAAVSIPIHLRSVKWIERGDRFPPIPTSCAAAGTGFHSMCWLPGVRYTCAAPDRLAVP